ncbi:MAG: RNA methyltransferase [Marinosulfonomonas sp.]|nr:RNA methyltransferase [Marinosulfonomonas sp.]
MSLASPQPSFVLVEPQMGENIGGAARAMLNFGLNRMAVVNPRDGWPNQRAIAMASGAARVLDDAVVHKTTAEAIADCTYVFATTARHRDLTKPVMSPERAMEHARSLLDAGQGVAILFGPERSGLENHDIALADAIISVPVSDQFASLNLAQCALLIAYEWRRQTTEILPESVTLAKTEFASKIEIEKLGDHYEQRMDTAGFFFPEAKAIGMKLNLRNMWSRMPLTKADVQIFHGMLRQMVRWKERGE